MTNSPYYTQEISSALESAGAEAAAIFHSHKRTLEEFLPALRQWQRDGNPPQLALPECTGDLATIEQTAKHIRSCCSHLLVMGTGGSSLGAQTLCALQAQAGPVTLHFLDNTDPHSLTTILNTLPPQDTALLAVSKSGSTVETLVQVACTLDWLGKDAGERLFAITVPGDTPLRSMAEGQGGTVLDHDPTLGGRYSVLSVVGLLPAAVAGVNIQALRQGAAEVMRSDLLAPMEGAALQCALAATGKPVSILMPYCDRLKSLADWYCQLWAESLGKDGNGTTPVRAIGAVDQHSQLQLWLGGPRDKLLTLLLLDNAGHGPQLPDAFLADERLAYLRGHHCGDVIDAQQRATLETLVKHAVPVRTLRLKSLDEKALGALLQHYMLETILAAHLLGVDAFDQPAVEESKILAREYLEGR